MDAEIYYFSGTGNSLAVAEAISKRTNSKLLPITAQIRKDRIPVQADVIGIVFPVYYTDVPPLVKRFLETCRYPDVNTNDIIKQKAAEEYKITINLPFSRHLASQRVQVF